MYRHLLALLILPLALLAGPVLASEGDAARTALHLLDYIAVDYAEAVENGKVRNADEYAEMSEFAAETRRLVQTLPSNPAQATLLGLAEGLQRGIARKAAPPAIVEQARTLRWAVIRAYDVRITPRQVPELAKAAALYASQCAACHGETGRGDGLAGKTLEPTPSDFHDLPRMAQRSVYGLYNTISLGVNGTGMAAYSQLSDDERWALALYVANFGADETGRAHGRTLWEAGQGRDVYGGLDKVLTLSTEEVLAQHGEDAVALQQYLRSAPQVLAAGKPAPLVYAAQTLQRSLDQYRQGQRAQAAQLSIQAYLEGFELAEAGLQNVDGDLVLQIEREMMALRAAVQKGAPAQQVAQQTTAVIALLDLARDKLDSTEFGHGATFVSALLILLREGVEAILVVVAILAFTRRAGHPEATRWVHAGWILALLLGGMTWVVSTYLIEISGADREITEGITALIAAGMLLYIGYWMHSKANNQAWQKFIGGQLNDSLTAGTFRSLALVSFLAVYREAFETVLFLQALSTQAGPQGHGALLGGLGGGTLLLVGAAWLILRASVKLPLGLFFSASGLLLVVLAVIFTGQGVVALQEAGTIGATAVDFIRVPLLGIYPTLQSLLAQAGMVVLSVLALRRAARGQQA